ncbi:MAG: alpha/beta hydrolase [Chitinispirillaceae bacterium]
MTIQTSFFVWNRKANRSLLFLILVSVSCTSLVNRIAFSPDTETSILQSRLPEWIKVVSIPTSDGLTLQGLYIHKKIKKPGVIIYFHGNAGNMYHRIRDAYQLYSFGYDVLIVSYRGYAGSEGRPSEKGVYIDGQSAVEYAKLKLQYEQSNIVIYGRSIGTAVAVDVAQNRNIKKLILITPLSTGADVGRATGLGFFQFLVGSPFDSMAKINNVKCPVLVIHGTQDEMIPYRLGKKLYRAYKGKKRMVTIEDGSHNDLEIKNPAMYWNAVGNFLINDQ